MIGNTAYVKKNYPGIIEMIHVQFDILSKKFMEEHPRAKKNIAFRLALERHYSKNRAAWHGIEVRKDRTWQPKSFYGGYAYLNLPEEGK